MTEKISDRQMSHLIEWLEQRTNATCPFCGSRSWIVDDELASLLCVCRDQEDAVGSRGHTLVVVTCDACGFTAPFAAKLLEAETGREQGDG